MHQLSTLAENIEEYTFAGKSIAQLATIAGQTPFYAYDKRMMLNTISELKQQLPDIVKYSYAVKANPYPGVVNLMAKALNGLDVASHKELILALSAGIDPKHIYFTGPGKSDVELSAAIAAGITINIESLGELERAQSFALQQNKKINIALRVNANIHVKRAGMVMAGGAKPFGIDESKIPEILGLIDNDITSLLGFHCYFGSQILDEEMLVGSYRYLLEMVGRLCSQHKLKLEYINLGGGLGVPYFDHQQPISLQKLGQGLAELFFETKDIIKAVDIHLELGRYLVAAAGTYVCQIVDIKESFDKNFVIVNGGMHHHLANSGNLGQVIRKNYPIVHIPQVSGTMVDHYNVVGPLCTPLDIVASNLAMTAPATGDYVAVQMSGAYGASASPKDFLSQPHVAEVLV